MLHRTKVAIGLGSNVGDRESFLRQATDAISTEFLEEAQFSNVYESPPWGITDQPHFLNAVIVGISEWPPPAIINYLKDLEHSLGRKPREKNGPREIDLDLIAYGSEIWQEHGIDVPHPRMFDRDFVLLPFYELWPEWKHPITKQTVSSCYDEFVSQNKVLSKVIDFKLS